MPRLSPLLGVVIAGLLHGCISHRIITPQAALRKEVRTGLMTGDFDVIGTAKGESSGGTVFCLIPYGDSEVEPPPLQGDREVPLDGRIMAAVLNALSSVEGADALLRARIAYSSYNWLLWCSWSVEIAGDAITYRSEE